ncbi:zinc finger MYM-type protein 1-like [Olea europaea var. sylvestris]|uniref:zinc finger MYM-type protein 1-like n=1 Tax=Olea europaea var. sylvestris TaxID=158386 RepID=UPI000C1D461C|nr:zinc finger MYM-type protein 1-like [Olea europaea var. sylvestris]
MTYLDKGPCQPYGHDFPRRPMGNDNRCFRKEWFFEFHWIEYSIEKDAAYYLHCYLFKPDRGGQGGEHIFTKTGFRDWKHKKTLKDHVGLFDTCCKEIEEILFSNALGNDQMISPNIQKDLVNCCVVETRRAIINEMCDSLFSIFVDETRDNSIKEQMAVVLRFVDKSGKVNECLLGISHATNTCVQPLKDAIDAIFSTYGLSISSLRGQGYNGASNMSGKFNVLKALILRENPYAIYIHCFAHQFQLAVVTVARTDEMLGDFFNMLAIIVNLVGASCKHVDALRASYHADILKKLNIGELTDGISQFQEMSLAHPG